MAKGMRVWKAGDNLDESIGFKFRVTDADELVKAAAENFVEEQARAWRDVRQWADDQMELIEVEPGGSPNGPGASLSLTENLRTELPKLWVRHNIRSVLDVACGDLNWMRHVDFTDLTAPEHTRPFNYFGWDIDPELIVRAQQRAGEMKGNPHTWFEMHNILDTPFLNVDCILARHILIHLPNDYISAVLDEMRHSHAKYLLASNFPDETNDFIYDPTRYAWIGYMEHPVNLEAPPFNLTTKIDAIPETPGPAGVLTARHELALFKL
jgi:hypothetical protein